jgi:hypothetical protein
MGISERLSESEEFGNFMSGIQADVFPGIVGNIRSNNALLVLNTKRKIKSGSLATSA